MGSALTTWAGPTGTCLKVWMMVALQGPHCLCLGLAAEAQDERQGGVIGGALNVECLAPAHTIG